MKIRLIDKRLGFSGQNTSFKNESFFELSVGNKITQLGNGKDNGTIRTDLFKYPVEYVGSIMIQFDELEKMYAFKLPDKIDNEDIYLLYGSTDFEIWTEAVFSSKDRITNKISTYMRFYKPVFKNHNN